jgi:hypothetical protein
MRFRMFLLLASIGCDCSTAVTPTALVPRSQPAAPTTTPGTVTGRVRLEGEWWPDWISKQLSAVGGIPGFDPGKGESLVLGEGGTMANAYVAVKSGLGDRTYPTPATPVELHQTGVLYSPLVLGAMTKQQIIIRNLDEAPHWDHFQTQTNRESNRAMPSGKVEKHSFALPEVGIVVKCDVHSWMRAWVHVSDHPYFMVTGADGVYSLKDVPPGDYEILAWHPRFKLEPRVAKVNVVAGQTSILDFTFKAPRR